MTKLYSYWQALYMSLYSRDMYLDVGRGWSGTGFRYVALVSALCAAVLVAHWMSIVNSVDLSQPPQVSPAEEEEMDLNTIFVKLIAQVPVITITEGKISTRVEEPYMIYYPENNVPFAIIDTKGTYTSLDDTEAMVLLMEEQLIYRTADDEVEIYTVAELSQGDRIIDSYVLMEWVKQGRTLLLWIMPLVVLPVLAMLAFVYLTVRGLIFGLLGMLIGNALKVDELEYVDYVRLAMVASTPVALAYLLLFLFPPLGALRFLNAIIFVIGVWYIYFAAKANR